MLIEQFSWTRTCFVEQNSEKTTRKSMKVTVVGSARIMSYEDIVEAQKQRDIKEAAAKATQRRQSRIRGGGA